MLGLYISLSPKTVYVSQTIRNIDVAVDWSALTLLIQYSPGQMSVPKLAMLRIPEDFIVFK